MLVLKALCIYTSITDNPQSLMLRMYKYSIRMCWRPQCYHVSSMSVLERYTYWSNTLQTQMSYHRSCWAKMVIWEISFFLQVQNSILPTSPPFLLVHGKMVFYKTSSWCQNVWGLLQKILPLSILFYKSQQNWIMYPFVLQGENLWHHKYFQHGLPWFTSRFQSHNADCNWKL